MRRISIALLLFFVLSLIGCTTQTETNDPQKVTPSKDETLWYQNMKLDTNSHWSAQVVETDTHFYFLAEGGVYQYQKDIKESIVIITEAAYGLSLCENNLYYHTEHAVKCMDLRSKNVSVIWNETMLPTGENADGYHYISISDFALLDGYLYIAGTGTSVMRVDLENYATEQFLEDCGGMVLLGDDCYYLDHAEKTFSLYHMTCDSKKSMLLRGKGESYPDEMLIDGIAAVGDAVAYSVRDTADVYLYRPDGSDDRIFDGANSEQVWLSIISQGYSEKLYFYTTDGSQLKLYEYQSETGVSLLTAFDCTRRICDVAITDSMVFWWSEEESLVKCFVRE